jgi:transcriptional regulator with XRE-family HTH domain
VPADAPDQQLAAAIRHLREQRELTQEDLAYHAGVRAATLSEIETGLSNPSWTTVVRIAGALHLRPWELARAAEEDD